jgi:predicted alpha/beta-fold hydrolase
MTRFSPNSFAPAPLLSNPHLQTFSAALMGRAHFLHDVERWFISVAGEKNQVRCDCSWQKDPHHRTTAIICHGLGGSSSSPIVIGMAAALWKAGLNVVRYNMRNCGGTEDRCRTLYHSGMHGDMLRVIDELIARECQSIVLIGFSAGGNLVLNTVASLGTLAPPQLKAAATICGALDVGAAADALHKGLSRFYEWRFVRELEELFKRKAKLYPDLFRLHHLRRFKSIRDFDNEITAPYSGFRDADDIYASISSARWIDRISVPTLVIQSKDDPFIRVLPGTREKLARNSHITFIETEDGGHCGFIGANRRWWADDTVEGFFASVLREQASVDAVQVLGTAG